MHKLDFNIDPDCLKFARSKHKKTSNLWTTGQVFGLKSNNMELQTDMFSASDSFSL